MKYMGWYTDIKLFKKTLRIELTELRQFNIFIINNEDICVLHKEYSVFIAKYH